MKWRKVMAFSLAASMIAGQAVSAAPAAEAASESALQTQADSKSNTNASYTDPWTKTAVPNQAAKVTSDVDKTKFTHKEWNGENLYRCGWQSGQSSRCIWHQHRTGQALLPTDNVV